VTMRMMRLWQKLLELILFIVVYLFETFLLSF